MRHKMLYLLLFLGLFTIACGQKKEKTVNRVVDNAHILTDEQISSLTEQIIDLEKSVGSQIVILTIESLEGEKMEDYSLRIANEWGIGRKDYDDGILITVSIQDRLMRIEVGYGLEKIIKDEIADQISREDMVPSFRTNDYYEGLYKAVNKIKALIKDNEDLVGQRY